MKQKFKNQPPVEAWKAALEAAHIMTRKMCDIAEELAEDYTALEEEGGEAAWSKDDATYEKQVPEDQQVIDADLHFIEERRRELAKAVGDRAMTVEEAREEHRLLDEREAEIDAMIEDMDRLEEIELAQKERNAEGLRV